MFWHRDSKPSKGDDFEAMTVDELIEWKLVRKRQIEVIRDQLKVAHAVYTRKLIEWHTQEALKRVGMEGVVLSPGPAEIKARGK